MSHIPEPPELHPLKSEKRLLHLAGSKQHYMKKIQREIVKDI